MSISLCHSFKVIIYAYYNQYKFLQTPHSSVYYLTLVQLKKLLFHIVSLQLLPRVLLTTMKIQHVSA